VARDAESALPPDVAQDLVGRLVRAHVACQAETDDVRVLPAAEPVLCDFGARHDQQTVSLQRPLRFLGDVGEVGVERVASQAEAPAAERGDAGGARQ
jgi:hypothetical protein